MSTSHPGREALLPGEGAVVDEGHQDQGAVASQDLEELLAQIKRITGDKDTEALLAQKEIPAEQNIVVLAQLETLIQKLGKDLDSLQEKGESLVQILGNLLALLNHFSADWPQQVPSFLDASFHQPFNVAFEEVDKVAGVVIQPVKAPKGPGADIVRLSRLGIATQRLNQGLRDPYFLKQLYFVVYHLHDIANKLVAQAKQREMEKNKQIALETPPSDDLQRALGSHKQKAEADLFTFFGLDNAALLRADAAGKNDIAARRVAMRQILDLLVSQLQTIFIRAQYSGDRPFNEVKDNVYGELARVLVSDAMPFSSTLEALTPTFHEYNLSANPEVSQTFRLSDKTTRLLLLRYFSGLFASGALLARYQVPEKLKMKDLTAQCLDVFAATFQKEGVSQARYSGIDIRKSLTTDDLASDEKFAEFFLKLLSQLLELNPDYVQSLIAGIDHVDGHQVRSDSEQTGSGSIGSDLRKVLIAKGQIPSLVAIRTSTEYEQERTALDDRVQPEVYSVHIPVAKPE